MGKLRMVAGFKPLLGPWKEASVRCRTQDFSLDEPRMLMYVPVQTGDSHIATFHRCSCDESRPIRRFLLSSAFRLLRGCKGGSLERYLLLELGQHCVIGYRCGPYRRK